MMSDDDVIEYHKHKQAQETIRDMFLRFVDTSKQIYNDFIICIPKKRILARL